MGGAYKALSRTLLEGLPPSAGDRARELLVRLQGRIACDEALTFDLDEREDTEEVDRTRTGPENLEEAARSGRTNAQGMQILFYRLLLDAGLKPRLALLADRRIRDFNFEAPIAWQFTDGLLGVDEPGQPTLWLDPTRKGLPPGTVAPGLQGASGLLVDPEGWSFQRFSMPFQPQEANARRYQARFAPEGAGLGFRAQVNLAGCAAYAARLRGQVPAAAHAGAAGGLAWEEEGLLARGVLRPFPGLRPFLPEGTPAATCAVPIVQAVNELQEAVCILELPPGAQLEAPPALSHANAFGSVAWNLAFEPGKTGRQAILTFRIQAHALVAAPADYAQFLAFRAWVAEAEARTLLWVQP
jgi:hypothetical protein